MQPTGVGRADTFQLAQKLAEIQARGLADNQAAGIELGADEIRAYSRRPPPLEALDQLIELALLVGVSGIAGVVTRYVGKHVAGMLARPVVEPVGKPTMQVPLKPGRLPNPDLNIEPPTPSGDEMAVMIGDGLKEGMKQGAKLALKAPKGSQPRTSNRGGQLSKNWQIEFVNRHRQMMVELQTQYESTVARVGASFEGSPHGTAAMNLTAQALNYAAATALPDQARIVELEWIGEVARHSLGREDVPMEDGHEERTTALDKAREYGPRNPYTETRVAKHDGVLDIHVDLPSGNTPVERSTFKVRRASITGVSQEIAEKLKQTKLASAGIPIRLVVAGHPALITRDEIGRVRVNGWLPNEHGKWSATHMHRAATMLVDKVLSQTLDGWGVTIETDDATGLEPPK